VFLHQPTVNLSTEESQIAQGCQYGSCEGNGDSLEAVPRLKAVTCLETASRQIFTALVLVLVLDFSALVLKVDVLALASTLEVNVLVLPQDQDQDANL